MYGFITDIDTHQPSNNVNKKEIIGLKIYLKNKIFYFVWYF